MWMKEADSVRGDNKSVLVTGGAGFIGSHLCKALVRRGVQVTVVDNLSNSGLEGVQEIADRIDFHELDIRSSVFRDLLLTGDFDVIFHLAANAYVPPSIENPDCDFQTNLVAPFRLLETLRGSGSSSTLIVASSAAVYGNPSRIPILETDLTVPISPYGVSKLAMERYVSVYSRVYGLRAASLRLFSAYGPRQRKQIVYDFIKKISNSPSELVILGDGTQVRDLVYVEDVVQAALTVLDSAPLHGEVYNVSGGRGYSTREIAETMTEVMGLSPRFHYTGSTRPGDPEKWIACIDRIRALGFSPRISLAEGMKRTIEWYNSSQ
jgi:UDP-glucose 4-epimerase